MFLRERGKQLSLQERGAIVGLYEGGQSFSEIAENMSCHPNTVRNWIKRYGETFDVKRQIGSGRPFATTPAEDELLLDSVRSKPITTAQEITGIIYICQVQIKYYIQLFIKDLYMITFSDITGVQISRTTIYRRLKKHGIRARVMARKDFLTPAQKELRLAFATEYGDKNEEWWKSVIFSDEKSFGLDH